ncbi:hypothetical protein [Sulfuriroseicoccus oceanibius]|uniref:Uncharacterized protein n=1 Tax=Sulfuriroseicoccus oceanibius TaxID=2707525 RepID=A0A6B3LE51_9BACT|nr:hypothetical protein [Sulfuriroseicoccus oceanibius]QQL45998.1 hypothetical protein G3M56_005310 [Sulfuriroseicoccus oceanibius]
MNKILLSGLRATLVMNDGATLEEATVKKALTEKGLKITSFTAEQATEPAATYHLKVAGTG